MQRVINRMEQLCQCGCGQPAPLSKDKWRGVGRPLKYIKGHKKAHTTHGGSKTPEYGIYCSAKNRCRNPNVKQYPDYGGRGIEFRFVSFEQFIETVGWRPSRSHTIDRIDNDGHYEPGNVRWATRLDQISNRRVTQSQVAMARWRKAA